MFSLQERFESLERDLLAQPMRISAYEALPFAIVQYDPHEEWLARQEMRRCGTRLEHQGKRVRYISLAALLWETIEACEGIDAVINLERDHSFATAQSQVTTYLSDVDWEHTLVATLAARLNRFDAKRDIVFLWRAAALAPKLYFLSKLLDEMQGQTDIPTVLLYPGALEGATGLYFMSVRERDVLGNYRVKIYGQESFA